MKRALSYLLMLAGCSSNPAVDSAPDMGQPDSGTERLRCVPETDEDCRLDVERAEQPCRFDGHAPGDVPTLTPMPAPSVGRTDIATAAWTGEGWIVATSAGVILDGDGGEIADRSGSEIIALTTANGLVVWSRRTDRGLTVELAKTDGTIEEIFRIDMSDPTRAGGGVALEENGVLWVGVGDGGYAWNAIDENSLMGAILRVDVTTTPYSIPSDNPNAGHATKREELWAFGVRDPTACNSSNGELLCADRGEEYVEINRITRRADYGWPYRDGSLCVEGTCNQRQSGPVASRLAHDECELIPGPHLSDEVPDGRGVRAYAGRCSGRLWGVRATDAGLREIRKMGQYSSEIAGIGGFGAAIRTLAVDGAALDWTFVDDGSQFPVTIAGSGCVKTDGSFASTLIPYDIATPLWTDGQKKERTIALPPGEKVSIADDGTLTFPDGTAILKLFSAELTDGTLQPLETRVMRKVNGDWDFYTYVWEGGDGTLLDGSYEIAVDEPAGLESYMHHVPSRTSCRSCHLDNLPVLGPVAPQLERDVILASGVSASQMELFQALGVIDGASSAVALVDFADPSQPLQARARSYLHANCSHCHRPNGWAPRGLGLDLRYTTALGDTGTCGVEAGFGKTWADGDYRIDPGDPENSNLLQRMLAKNAGRMPPLGTAIVDNEGGGVVEEWIASLTSCD